MCGIKRVILCTEELLTLPQLAGLYKTAPPASRVTVDSRKRIFPAYRRKLSAPDAEIGEKWMNR
ncbi:hypothetical protein J6590_057295 [Homalodisca vitripennis]|nr:hypothetical protein J6590_101557 [Homalodisca vitripennis]KAG8325844.1 hypothetical protein J6590_057295 [Homalodisca vitripennis]